MKSQKETAIQIFEEIEFVSNKSHSNSKKLEETVSSHNSTEQSYAKQ